MRSWIPITLLFLLFVPAAATATQSHAVDGDAALSPDGTTVSTVPVPVRPGTIFPGTEWAWAESPEALGWSSEKLAAARAYADRIGSAAVMIVDDGLVVDAWGDIERKYHCHSMRKSLMSALYGVFFAEGAIDLGLSLEDLGIDDKMPLTRAEKQATVADLLKARSGVYIPAAGEAQSMRDVRPERGSHAAGTFWYYNNWDFNTLGTIFNQETDERSIYTAFQARIAQPIGMQDYRPESLRYSYVDYSEHPYYGFDMSTRDLARFGLLFLREGRWRDKRIVTREWVRESTASHSEIGPESGYGYMWWTGSGNGLFSGVRVAEHCYYASGYGGHLVVVLPYLDLVIVHRVDTFQPGNEVPSEAFGVLLWLILDAAGQTDIGEPPFIDLAPGVRLDERGLRDTIPGSTLRAVDGPYKTVAVSELDGTLSLYVDGTLIYTGTWWIEEDRYCADVPGTDIGGCLHAVLDGNTLRFYELDGSLSIKFTIMEDGS